MSASDKKKLRKEERQAQLTERQLAEQKEAKQLKRNTLVFVVAVALVLVIGIGLIAYNWFAGSGLTERWTTAVEVGEHKLSAAELNYYYIDILNNLSQDWYSTYLLQQEGFKPTVALDQQQYKDEAGKTWADHFIEEAMGEAAGILALCDEAGKAGYAMTDEDKANIEETMVAIKTQAELSGFGSTSDYLKAYYGKGAQEKTFRTYLENMTLAQSYYNHYTESLSYTADDLAAEDKENPGHFSAFDYTFYELSAEDFIEHATEGEHDHSEEELAEALKKAEEIAKELVASGATNKEELDKAIANLEMYKTEETEETEEETSEETTGETAEESTEATNEEASATTEPAETTGEATEATEESKTEESTEATEENTETTGEAIEEEVEANPEDGEEGTTEETEEETTSNAPTSSSYTDYDYSYIPTEIAEWLAAEGRKVGEIGYVPYFVLDDEGEATEEIEGYYVVILDAEDKREENLVSVRHILVKFQGGTEDENTGELVYSESEKKATMDKATEIKTEFEAGAKTEDAFAELAKKYSEDNAEDGGLYEDVYPGQMETGFEDWCFEEGRKTGDTGIVETSYGYHVMYYVETQENTYREYLIENHLRSEAADEWYVALQDSYKAATKVLDTSYVSTSIILSGK